MERLEGLDGLRGIAALMVLGFHLWTVFGILPLLSHAYLAVDFFFMLSGYVMARTYEPKFSAGLSPVSFTSIRFKRLFAPMALGAMLGLGLFMLMGTDPKVLAFTFIATLAFIPQPLGDPFILNRPAWSIFFELTANLIHAILLWRLPLKAVLLFALIFLVALMAYAWPWGSILVGNKTGSFMGGFPRVLLAYAIGVALWRGPKSMGGRVEIAFVVLGIALVALPRNLLVDIAFVVAVCPVILLIGAKPASRLAAWMGALSFPLYAVHYPILQGAKAFNLSPWLAAVSSIALAALYSFATNRDAKSHNLCADPAR
ncbi:acyltransferase [Novosphingobium sp. KN65.2]|uniref:acyltransferase family protein n=1 Tax=Novosphingobium sp. KN65.2 TaxID=1478134 RepID=UPI0005E1FEC9|nr:acyltransferase [Novosphingobium sp. KN65.2]CDO34036.1 membrane hypothetical protein [Novosphingobium sp. KN65.2]